MNRGFYCILAAQFFSALADNALLFAAIALLKKLNVSAWQVPVLQQGFVFAFIVLAPFVGPFADALPKGNVMFISNLVKVVGCMAMLFGLHPPLAYGLVGIGAAMYSPAKYGILSEYFPPERLVWANGWMEGLTVAAIILGAVVGGMLIGDGGFNAVTDTTAEIAISVVLVFYMMAALANLFIPELPIDHKLAKRTPWFVIRDFWHCLKQLWRDPLGQVSLAVTSLFWGAGTTLRLIILTWASTALGLGLERATQLTAVVAIGIAFGAGMAARTVPLAHSVRVLRVGVAMGLTVAAMVFVSDWRIAIPLLLLMGAMGGYFVVPMNALLQHRGHLLMGAGHSIAVQNFNENLSILLMLGAYALMIEAEVSVSATVVVFGIFVASAIAWLAKKHGEDQV